MKSFELASLEIRPGETTIVLPSLADESVFFIGHLRTPWRLRSECPKRGDPINGPLCSIEIDSRWQSALEGIERHERLQILYWMHRARRDLVRQSPRSDGNLLGTFALRSPMRPNPIASSLVALVSREETRLVVRGLDCLDGTPVIDIKPEHCPHAK